MGAPARDRRNRDPLTGRARDVGGVPATAAAWLDVTCRSSWTTRWGRWDGKRRAAHVAGPPASELAQAL